MRLQTPDCSKTLGLLAGLLIFAACGCAPGAGTVTGKVLYDDKPLSVGTVTFFGPNNAVVSTAIQPDGSYRAEGVPAGEVRATVVTPPRLADPPAQLPAMPPLMDPTFPRKMAPPSPHARPTVAIPRCYADPEQSGLTLTVKRNHTQPFDITLHDR